jgi:hypothetical protein
MIQPIFIIRFLASFFYSFFVTMIVLVNLMDIHLYWKIGLSVYFVIEMIGVYLIQRKLSQRAKATEDMFMSAFDNNTEEE